MLQAVVGDRVLGQSHPILTSIVAMAALARVRQCGVLGPRVPPNGKHHPPGSIEVVLYVIYCLPMCTPGLASAPTSPL